jgi:hypothetical protein
MPRYFAFCFSILFIINIVLQSNLLQAQELEPRLLSNIPLKSNVLALGYGYASGASIVIEYTKSELKIHDAPLGIITNSPNYDWHITNLSNYINLSQYSFPAKQISGVEIKQIGDEIIHINFDDKKEQDIKDITPKS